MKKHSVKPLNPPPADLNGWVDVEDPDVQDIIELFIDPKEENNCSSKPLLAEDSKGKYHVVYAIIEEEEGDWTTSGFYDCNVEDKWHTDIVRVKRIIPKKEDNS